MMVAPEYYIFTGRAGERIPYEATHVLIDKALNFVPANACQYHRNIQELICHDGVEKIEQYAFYDCPNLRRVIMPGVKVLEKWAFKGCGALTYIECGKLERIGERALSGCKSLSSVDLPSIKIVGQHQFAGCVNLTSVKFGKDLESIKYKAFFYCCSLERITTPLKGGVITNSIFQHCAKLNHVDLVGGVHETVAALLMEEWRNDMNNEIDAINRILPNIPAGRSAHDADVEKTQAIQTWITSVLRKIIHYKAEHRRKLNEATAILQSALPNDIILKNVLPFLELPSYTFEGEE